MYTRQKPQKPDKTVLRFFIPDDARKKLGRSVQYRRAANTHAHRIIRRPPFQPTGRPTNQPANQPTNQPTNQPANRPTAIPVKGGRKRSKTAENGRHNAVRAPPLKIRR
ncbi:PT domain-containing protein [uncultured Alistipes sp.]|uniref:PT domain-containing protein n=1 Tax=uncultured Alistipes sp. TaxID=538949 RepID=UPI00338E7A3B